MKSEDFIESARVFLQTIIKDSIKEELSQIKNELANQPKQENEKEIMFVQDAAAFLNRAVSTIYSLVQQGLLPHYKRGRQLIFRRSELNKWINDGKQI